MKKVIMALLTLLLGVGGTRAQEESGSRRMLFWSMAFGAGTAGLAGFSTTQGLNKSATYAFDLQFGYAINDYMYLGLDLAAVPQADFAWPGSTIDYVNYSVGITFFPINRVYLRLAPSIGYLEGGESFGLKDFEPGYGFMAGGGVEFKMIKIKDSAMVSLVAGLQYFYHGHKGFYTQSNLIAAGAMFSVDIGKLIDKTKEKPS